MCLCMYVNVWVFGVCFMCGHISVRTLCSKQQYGARCSQVTKKPRATASCQWMSPIYPTNQPTHHPTKLINQPNLSIYPTNQPANSSTNLTYRPTKLINQPSDQPTNQLTNYREYQQQMITRSNHDHHRKWRNPASPPPWLPSGNK